MLRGAQAAEYMDRVCLSVEVKQKFLSVACMGSHLTKDLTTCWMTAVELTLLM